MNIDPPTNFTAEPGATSRVARVLCAALILAGLSAQALPPPNGIAPVTTPAGGFGIGGQIVAGTSGMVSGDWMPGANGAAGVLDSSGAPLDSTTTFHFIDANGSKSDNVFSSGKWMDDPNTWTWTTSGAQAKGDINHVLMHVATDTNFHTWLILAADRAAVNGSSYIDFELLQNTLVANVDGSFTSSGPHGGRTVNDMVLTLLFSNGGSTADFLAYRWQTNSSSGGYTYVDSTAALPAGKVFIAVNSNSVAVPFGAFGSTNYQPMAFIEAAVDMSALMGNFDQCLSIGVKSIIVKTKSAASGSASLVDFVGPLQYRLLIGPGADAGPDQAKCTEGASTAFALQGVANRGELPITSTFWSIVSGSATIDSLNSLTTTAHVSSPSATLRLTVVQANGCVGTSDIVLTVNPIPQSSIAGPSWVFPQTTTQFSGPAGMSNYTWSISGNGSISGSANSQTVSVIAGSTCGASYTLSLAVSSKGCGTTATQDILISDTGLPILTLPANVTLELPADTSTSATGVATAHDNSGNLPVNYNDVVTPTCGGAKVITRTWSTINACGFSVSASQIITVQDTTPPTVTAPANVTVGFTADISTDATGTATAEDTAGSVSLQHSDAVAVNADGSQTLSRTWTATDDCGNQATALQTITLSAPSPLVLPAQPDVVLTNLATLIVTNTATDPNGSSNPLSYQLINPPAGVTIDSNGVIDWTPGYSESPSTNVITTVVTASEVSSAGSTSIISITNTFLVIITTPYDGLDMGVDTDGDGLTNLVEFAVGSDPKNSGDGSAGIIVWITENNGTRYLAMKFKRRVNAAALHLQYVPEVSADKVTWNSDAANVLEVSVAPADAQFDWVTVNDLTAITPEAARFIHLRVISDTLESASPTWIGTAATVKGNDGTGAKFTTFSQRMVLPIVYAGTVSNVQNTALTDGNAAWNNAQFGSSSNPTYAEFDNGYMVDIAGTPSSQSLALAGDVSGLVNAGDTYRVRQHFTIASLFGTNNEVGLKMGLNPASADNIMLIIPETQETMTIFYASNEVAHGWYRADFTRADDQVVYPEQGIMVRRILSSDLNVYLCGPIKTGVTVAPLQPGFNNLGTLKSLSPMTLNSLNLYTGNAASGMASGLNPAASDNVLVVQPDGSMATYFYFKDTKGHEGWLDARFNLAGNTPIPAGSAFFIKRLPANGPFNWLIPAE